MNPVTSPRPIAAGRRSSRGFTLIELMVTVAIVAILATIAAETYTSQVQKSRRTDARSALLDLAGREEKLYSVMNQYSQNPPDLGYTAPIVLMSAASPDYNVTIQVPDPNQGVATPTTYLITATATGIQAGDSTCQTLTLNQLGQQASSPGTASTCWGN